MIFSLTISLIPANENELLIPLYVSFRHELKTFPSLKHLLSYKRQSQLPDQPFCLELACLLLESSYQAYFRSKLPLPLPASASTAGNNSEVAVTISDKKEGEETEEVQLISSTSSADDNHIATTATIDVERLGFSLKHVFYCPELAIFGYLSESKEEKENDSSLLIAFRGSTTRAHISLDFMFTLMPLPSLKRKTAFFDRILEEEIISSSSCSNERNNDVSHVRRGGSSRSAASSSSSSLTSSSSSSSSSFPPLTFSSSYQNSTSPTTTLSIHKKETSYEEDDIEQQQGFLQDSDRQYSADSLENTPHSTTWEKDIDITTTIDKDTAAAAAALEEKQSCSEKMKSCGKSIINRIPFINQSFPRIHVGFWQAYSSIREQFMSSITRTIYHKYRKQFTNYLTNRQQEEGSNSNNSKRGVSSNSLVNEAMDLDILISGHSLGSMSS
jgi:hypothetical protein